MSPNGGPPCSCDHSDLYSEIDSLRTMLLALCDWVVGEHPTSDRLGHLDLAHGELSDWYTARLEARRRHEERQTEEQRKARLLEQAEAKLTPEEREAIRHYRYH